MEKYQCLVCGKDMERHHKIKYIDWSCAQQDHHFSWRIVSNQMAKLRIRFENKGERLCLKVHYDEGYSEVWSKANSANRLRINQIVVPNFEDIEALKHKIRTILVFS